MADKHIFTLRGSLEGGAYVTEKNGQTSVVLRLRRVSDRKGDEPTVLCIVCRKKGSRDAFYVASTEINGSASYDFSGSDVCAVMIAEKREGQISILCSGFHGMNQVQSARAAYEVRTHMQSEYKDSRVMSSKEKQTEKTENKEAEVPLAPRVLKAGEAYRSSRVNNKTKINEKPTYGSGYQNRSEAVKTILDQASRLFYPIQERKTSNGEQKKPIDKQEGIASAEAVAIPNPFPISFPNSYWWHDGRDKPIYGKANADGKMLSITAVEGKWSPRPPRNLRGFNKFYTAYDGKGYWLRITSNPKDNSNIGKR